MMSLDAENTEIVEEFDKAILGGKLKTYFELSKKIGGDVSAQAELVKQTFDTERATVVTASKYKQPSQALLASLCKPLVAKVDGVQDYCDKHRGSKQFNHLMTVKEGIGCVGWVSVSPKPAPYVKECFNQSLFYGNRVLKEFKGKDDTHVQWMRAFTGAIQELEAYVKEYHTTGLTWNPEGSEYTGGPPSAPSGPPGAGPPPPPPPAVQPPAPSTSSGEDDSAARANLFASINKGGDITKGLRRVTDDMKTHKNPELRASSVVKAQDKTSSAPKKTPKYGTAAPVKKPPVLELQGKKWIVEYQDNQPSLEITQTNSKQSIYVFRCNKSTLKVSGKVNSIILDSCKRMALCFDDVIAGVEIVNSQGIQVQVTGGCRTVSIDKTDGCQVFLSSQSLNCEIVSAKSSEMNICIPGKEPGDFSEHPVPEQFKTVWNGKALVTECTDIAS